ncbi:hypothetical protein LCGC14_1391160 [marine sediment metagenome]|uniref:Intein C-terminal splicing domain-containing protein n=1 Tax=marine sediment metagenome TaxID=412755 RepID=A0A0F9MFK3_9ZZZZ
MRTPPTPADLNLPADKYLEWRPGQRQTIEDVLQAFDEYKYVLLNAPWGSGKTIVATAVQRLMDVRSVNLTHCLDPDTPVLMADFTWILLRDVVIGDEVISLDEYPDQTSRWTTARRKTRIAKVIGKVMEDAPIRLRVRTDKGSVIATPEHKWLVRNKQRRLEWKETQYLIPSDAIKWFAQPQTQHFDYRHGYIAAAFDGEGHVRLKVGTGGRGGSHLVFTQRTNSMLREVRRMLGIDGFTFVERVMHNGVMALAIRGGMPEIIRFLAMYRPKRLLDLLPGALEGFDPQFTGFATVQSVGSVGPGSVACIETTTGVFIANGLVSHNTIQLQNQYLETMDWASVVTGRRNHACELDQLKAVNATANEAPCKEGAKCEYIRPDGCSYYRTLYAAADNPQAVLNYAYATRILQSGGVLRGQSGNPFRRYLLVCDEGDLAEGAIIDAVTIRLDKGLATQFDAPYRSANPALLADWAIDIVHRIATWYKPQQDDALCGDHELPLCEDCGHRPSREITQKYRRSTAFVRALAELRGIGSPDDWIVTHDNRGISIRPIWGWTVSQQTLFRHFDKALIMSATLGDPKALAKKLALPNGEWVSIDVPCTFPVENRPAFYWPVVKVSRKTDSAEFDRLAAAINWIAEQDGLQEKKGIIHTGSFRIANELFVRLAQKSDRYVGHVGAQSGTKDSIIQMLRDDTRPLIALSPSLATGVDIPYEIGFQVIAKVPYGDLGDPVVRARKDYMAAGIPFGRQNYDGEAINTVVQAYGRAVRAPDDKGVTFILDGNFWSLYKRTYTPEYFSEALKWLRKEGSDNRR